MKQSMRLGTTLEKMDILHNKLGKNGSLFLYLAGTNQLILSVLNVVSEDQTEL